MDFKCMNKLLVKSSLNAILRFIYFIFIYVHVSVCMWKFAPQKQQTLEEGISSSGV